MNEAMYQPLRKILVYDDFDKGLNGWCPLTPNLSGDSFEYFESQKRYKLWGGPMLSNCTFPFLGTHGSMSGMYCMKLATRPMAGPPTQQPVPGSMAHAIKRLTVAKPGLLKIEAWFSYKAEMDRPGLGESDVRAFGFFCDAQDHERRYFFGARYLNAAAGKIAGKWEYFKASPGREEDWGDMGQSAVGEPGSKKKVFLSRGIDSQWLGKRFADGTADGYQDVPGGAQPLCFNETPDKINWHYFALTFDMKKREYVSLQAVDQSWDLRGIQPSMVEPFPRIRQLLNPVFFIEADANRRVFLFVDSVVISMDDA